MATFSAHTASPPPPSRTPAGSRASSRHASIAPRTTSARGPLAWAAPRARTHRSIPAPPTPAGASRLPRTVPYPTPAELVREDLGKAVQQLKREPGKGLFAGGVKLPLALAELGLIDEYEFVVQPRLAGHGPTLFAGLSRYVDLRLVSLLEFGSGGVVIAM